MASTPEHISMALFCDFENVALGVRDANYEKFDIKRVLERLLLKGSIVVKKAYCDWDRYRNFKSAMHEANFELIEIPHVRQSGKNSADIRLVVDALDLCYTKSHVNTFVIISGDSDFSPLVSKLRENAKYVIGVGVKQSTSDLLTANCDEFIYYDDLVRESARVDARRNTRNNQPAPKRTPEEEARRRAELDARRSKAVEMAVETYEALVTDRDEGGKIWASVLKEAIKRRNPGFNENYYGFRTFGNLLEEAKARGLLEFGRDEKSSAFVFRGTGISTLPETATNPAEAMDATEASDVTAAPLTTPVNAPTPEAQAPTQAAPLDEDQPAEEVAAANPARSGNKEGEGRGRRRSRGGRDRGERHENRREVAPNQANSSSLPTATSTEVQGESVTMAPSPASTQPPVSAETAENVAAEAIAPAKKTPSRRRSGNAQRSVPAHQADAPSSEARDAAPTPASEAPAAKKTTRRPAAKKASTRAPRKAATPSDEA